MRLPGNMAPWNIYHVREYNDFDLKLVLNGPFGDVKIFGLTASLPVLAIEKARIEQSIKIARLDILNLRRKLPRKFLNLVIKALHLVLKGKKTKTVFVPDGSTKEIYSLGEYSAQNALDIVAVCVK